MGRVAQRTSQRLCLRHGRPRQTTRLRPSEPENHGRVARAHLRHDGPRRSHPATLKIYSASPSSPAFARSRMRFAFAPTSTRTTRSHHGPEAFLRSSSSRARHRTCMTPLLGWVRLSATWANVVEHAAGPHDYWGSRGRGLKSRRPDSVSAGKRLGRLVLREPSSISDRRLTVGLGVTSWYGP